MGFFSTTKKIKEKDFKKIIDSISGLTDKEKAYNMKDKLMEGLR